jgi:hypothetical protein
MADGEEGIVGLRTDLPATPLKAQKRTFWRWVSPRALPEVIRPNGANES